MDWDESSAKHTYLNEGQALRKRKTRSSYRNKSNLRADYECRRKKKNKKRRIENQKEKFRKSREWKDFRSKMAKLFDHKDYITGRRLVKGFNVHHLKTEQDSEDYCDISNENEFIPLNSYCHKLLHYLFPYYMKDKKIVERLVEILDKMVMLSPNYGIGPSDDIEGTIDGDDEEDDENEEESESECPTSCQHWELEEQGEDIYISGEELKRQMQEERERQDNLLLGTATISPESSSLSFVNSTVS